MVILERIAKKMHLVNQIILNNIFIKIFISTVLYSQGFLLAVIVVKSCLLFIDVILSHLVYFIVEPYLNFLWSTFLSWVSIYFSVPIVLYMFLIKCGRRNLDRSLLVINIFFKNILLSQGLVLVVIIIKSILPFLNTLIDHIFHYVIKPYLLMVWSMSFNWICVYTSVPLIMFFFVSRSQRDSAQEAAKTEPAGERESISTSRGRDGCHTLYSSLDRILGREEVTNLFLELTSLDAFNQEERENIDNSGDKSHKLMVLLETLNKNVRSKELLMEALAVLSEKRGVYSWFAYARGIVEKRYGCAVYYELPCQGIFNEDECDFTLWKIHVVLFHPMDEGRMDVRFPSERYIPDLRVKGYVQSEDTGKLLSLVLKPKDKSWSTANQEVIEEKLSEVTSYRHFTFDLKCRTSQILPPDINCKMVWKGIRHDVRTPKELHFSPMRVCKGLLIHHGMRAIHPKYRRDTAENAVLLELISRVIVCYIKLINNIRRFLR